ncbi:helix-turn-helix transcriptional regulator [Naumannella halotolerans]|uniref:HTH domain-containing protein n=1 Tax=Naumannella halotolerans TaxID=993414 RepID=A0A4R7J1M7_9ACTN|nr:HTH domain-containing protein [Naumannella halotolerans]TDT30974.1 HTH domain-containing protein [Naumannella halotolerans]
MKASRLLHLLLLLQTRQRITTGELAERLGVSRRTVLRDVEALSAAGVPVYAERGRNGGIVLLPGARLNASHLDPPELEALSVAGLDSAQLERLGLSAVWESATRKIAARQVATPEDPNPLRLAELVLVDSTAWFAEPASAIDISGLASALRHRRRMRIRYRSAEAAHRETGAREHHLPPTHEPFRPGQTHPGYADPRGVRCGPGILHRRRRLPRPRVGTPTPAVR